MNNDARPIYPERAERVMRDRTHYDGCYRVHPECALQKIEELERALDVANARAAQMDAIVVPNVLELQKNVFEMQFLFEKMTELFLCANAKKREHRKCAAQANTFRAAFEEWIVNQTEDVKFSAAMAFGLEYIQLKG